jgi:hypothetical protein
MLENDWYTDRFVLLYEETAGVHYARGASHPIWVLEGLLKALSLMGDQWRIGAASEFDRKIEW